MVLPYRKIFKQAYEIVRNHKFLWIFGLFLVWGNIFNLYYASPGDGGMDMPFIRSHVFLANLGLVLALAVILELILLFFRARAGMIIAVRAILDSNYTSFRKSFHVGRLFQWRLLGVSLGLQLCLLALTLLIGIPIFYLFSHNFFVRGVILLALGLLIYIPVYVLGVLIDLLAPMFVVLHDLKIGEAIRSGFELAQKFWLTLLIFGFLLLCLTILALFVSLAAISPFVLLAYLAYHKVGFGLGIGLGIAAGILGSIVFLAIQSAVASFQQAAWVLAFLELVKPQKLEEEEVEPIPDPEII